WATTVSGKTEDGMGLVLGITKTNEDIKKEAFKVRAFEQFLPAQRREIYAWASSLLSTQLRIAPEAVMALDEFIKVELFNSISDADLTVDGIISRLVELIKGRYKSDFSFREHAPIFIGSFIDFLSNASALYEHRLYLEEKGDVASFNLTASQEQQLRSGANVVLDLGAGKRVSHTLSLLEESDDLVVSIECAPIPRKSYLDELREKYPKLIYQLGFAELVRDERLKARVQRIDTIYPSPRILSGGGLFEFVNFYLQDGGVFNLVTECAIYQAGSRAAIESGRAYVILQDSLLTRADLVIEKRQVPAQLMPAGYRTAFYDQHFLAVEDNIIIDNAETNGVEFVDDEELRVRNAVPRGLDEELVNLGRVGDLIIDHLQARDYSSWKKEEYNLKNAKTPMEIAVYRRDSEMLVVYNLFDADKKRVANYAFRKTAEGWTVYFNKPIGSSVVAADQFYSVVSLFNQFAKKVLKESVDVLDIEVDLQTLGLKSLDENEVKRSVGRFIKNSPFEAKLKFTDDKLEVSHVSLSSNGLGVLLRCGRTALAPESKAASVEVKFRDRGFNEFTKAERAEIFANSVVLLRMALEFIMDEVGPMIQILEDEFAKLNSSSADYNLVDLQQRYQERASRLSNVRQNYDQKTFLAFSQTIGEFCHLLCLREHFGAQRDFSKFEFTPQQLEIITANQRIVLELGPGRYLTNVLKHLERDGLVVAIECEPMPGDLKFINETKARFPNLVYQLSIAELVKDPRLQNKASQIDVLFPAPQVFSRGRLAEFVQYYLAASGRVRMVTECGNYRGKHLAVGHSYQTFVQFEKAMLRESHVVTEKRRIPCPLVTGDLATDTYLRHLSKPGTVLMVDMAGIGGIEFVATEEFVRRQKQSPQTVVEIVKASELIIDYH
ncbi:MAG: hypothetical protein KBC84_11310, partial [Proteobacteria bacterium]|nr:hypothetical protein [Pseudomonadota bacterium]